MQGLQRNEFIVFDTYRTQRPIGVVLVYDLPFAFVRLHQDTAFGLDDIKRVEVISHDAWEVNMC